MVCGLARQNVAVKHLTWTLLKMSYICSSSLRGILHVQIHLITVQKIPAPLGFLGVQSGFEFLVPGFFGRGRFSLQGSVALSIWFDNAGAWRNRRIWRKSKNWKMKCQQKVLGSKVCLLCSVFCLLLFCFVPVGWEGGKRRKEGIRTCLFFCVKLVLLSC